MTKDRIKLLAKLFVGALLITYVLKSKMIDFSKLGSIALDPKNIVIAFFFLLFSSVICTFRWYLLVRVQGLSLSVRNLFSLTMIGAFFNTFMPGSVGGDLIKAWYVAGREKKQRTKAVLTVLLDRVIGLAVILFYAAVTLTVYSDWISLHPLLQPVAFAVWGGTSTLLLAAVLFYNPQFWRTRLAKKLLRTAARSSKIQKMLDASLTYRNHFKSFSGTILLSSASVLGINILYLLQGQLLGIEATIGQYFFIVPVALVIAAIPILPGGIGTGQVAFYHLFLWLGVPNPEKGGALCTLIQIYTIAFNCLGAFFYFRFKRDAGTPDLEKIDLNSSFSLA